MSLFLKKKLEDAALGVWEISETVEQLWKSVNLSEQELKYYSYLRSDTRRQHWLSYRLILPHLIRPGELTGIEYVQDGKPLVIYGLRQISVTDSGIFSALLASTRIIVGIVIELMSPKIFKVAHKFLNDCELRIVFSSHAMEGLFTIWAAKEALFKLHGRRDLQFREHIRILPFEFQGQGCIQGEIIVKDEPRVYEVCYQTLEDYILVYAVDR